MIDVVRHFPARLLMPDERTLMADWLAAAGDIASAYVSQRRGDDPNLLNRIVIATSIDDAPSHIVYAATGRAIWVVLKLGWRTRIRRYRTLRAALNSIRPVLPDREGEAASPALTIQGTHPHDHGDRILRHTSHWIHHV